MQPLVAISVVEMPVSIDELLDGIGSDRGEGISKLRTRTGEACIGLKGALEHSGPALIDVVTDPNALSMPSHISADQVKGFGLTMMKLVLSGHIDEVVETVEGNIRQI